VNSRNGFENALEKIRAEMIKAGCRGVIFAIETGGHFWRNFAYFLEERGLPFRLISQITLKRMRDGGTSIGARMTSGMPKWLPEYKNRK
jgi:transposase